MLIAVSGASGFIGQQVLRELQSRAVDTVALSRPVTYDSSPSANARWVAMDIANPPSDPFEAMGKPDALIHLAWGGLPNYQSRHHVDIELPLQLAFLTACVRSGLKKLVVTGTCYEYGLASGELSEEQPTRPCTQYGLAKDMLREALFGLREQYGFDLAWLRLFYLYGDTQSEKSLYRMLLTAISRGAKTFDMSGGEQLRDFLPVYEAARLIVEIAHRENINGVFNVCSGRPIAIRDLVQSWIDALGAKIVMNLGQIPYSPHEPMAFWGRRKKLDTIISTKTETPKKHVRPAQSHIIHPNESTVTSMEFNREVEDRLLANRQDKRLQAASHEFMVASTQPKYSYNFSMLGRPIIQYPQDMVAIQELIWKIKPDLVVETGIAHGGSLILSASMLALLDYCEAVKTGQTLDPKSSRRRVLGIDIDIRAHNRAAIEAHPMSHHIDMIQGSSISPDVVAEAYKRAAGHERVMVILDSNHTHDHVLAELDAYASLVSPGSYCVVFDTVIEDLPVGMYPERPWDVGDNPKTAVRDFLSRNHDFEVDEDIEAKLLITVAPGGYLRRR